MAEKNPQDMNNTMDGGPAAGGPAPIDGGAADALGGALGGAPADGPMPMDPGAAADAAIGSAMDGAMAQGGPAPADGMPGPDPMGGMPEGMDMPEDAGTDPADDPTAGIA